VQQLLISDAQTIISTAIGVKIEMGLASSKIQLYIL